MAKAIIISGKINSGKTSFLSDLSRSFEKRKTTGFLSNKKISKNKRTYYLNFINKAKKLRIAIVDERKKEAAFVDKNFKLAREKILKEIESKDIVFIDEFGFLEFNKGGHFELIRELSEKFKGIVILSSRKELARAIKRMFKYEKAKIFEEFNLEKVKNLIELWQNWK